MRLWLTVPIGPSDWNVYLASPDECRSLLEENGPHCEGVTAYDTSTIYINNTLKRDRWPDVLVHELLHAIIFVYGIDKAMRFSASREEQLISLVAPGLCAVMRDAKLFRVPRVPK